MRLGDGCAGVWREIRVERLKNIHMYTSQVFRYAHERSTFEMLVGCLLDFSNVHLHCEDSLPICLVIIPHSIIVDTLGNEEHSDNPLRQNPAMHFSLLSTSIPLQNLSGLSQGPVRTPREALRTRVAAAHTRTARTMVAVS